MLVPVCIYVQSCHGVTPLLIYCDILKYIFYCLVFFIFCQNNVIYIHQNIVFTKNVDHKKSTRFDIGMTISHSILVVTTNNNGE